MTKRKTNKNLWQLIVHNELLFWVLAISLSAATIGFFLIPFLISTPSSGRDVPLLSYVSIVFFFLCFWIVNKKTMSKK